MTDNVQNALSEAYELIEADKLEEARSVLRPILTDNPDNADAWWLYAHAVEEPEAARTALNNVMRVDREYPGAADLLDTLVKYAPEEAVMPEPPVVSAYEENFEADTFDLADDLEHLGADKFAGLERQQTAPHMSAEQPSGRSLLPYVLVAALVVIAIVAVIALLGGGSQGTGEEAATPTPESVIQSQQPSEGVLPATVPASDELATVFADALSSVGSSPQPAGFTTTDLGRTALGSICTMAGDEMRTALSTAMNELAPIAQQVSVDNPDVNALGVQLIDCDTQTVLRVIAAPVDAAIAYASGELDQESYEARWRAVA